MRVLLLAGGTGGAKLAVGLRDVLHGHDGDPAAQPGELTVVANTADDIEIYGVHVSPDPDLISFRLAGVLNEHGFGIADETHGQMDARRASGEQVWFELGDDDLAVCAARSQSLASGLRLTQAHAAALAGYPSGGASVLPMSDQPVRTIVETPSGERGIQQFLIQDRSEPEILGTRYDGLDDARPSAEVLAAIDAAQLTVIGPSNPVISIAPILSLPGLAGALAAAPAPVLAVSPLVGGAVLKGPTAEFLRSEGHGASTDGAADYYDQHFPGLIDAWIADEPVSGRAHWLSHVDMRDPAATRAVAKEVLRYGEALARGAAPA